MIGPLFSLFSQRSATDDQPDQDAPWLRFGGSGDGYRPLLESAHHVALIYRLV